MRVQQIGPYMHYKHDVNQMLRMRLWAKDKKCKNLVFKKAQDKHRITSVRSNVDKKPQLRKPNSKITVV